MNHKLNRRLTKNRIDKAQKKYFDIVDKQLT